MTETLYSQGKRPPEELTFRLTPAIVTIAVFSDSRPAGMTELADVQDLGSCAVRRMGSSPITRTRLIEPESLGNKGVPVLHFSLGSFNSRYLVIKMTNLL